MADHTSVTPWLEGIDKSVRQSTFSAVPFVTDQPPAPRERIEAIERAIGARLPNDYRAFLLRHDGGEVASAPFALADGRASAIGRLYSTRPGESYSLLEGLEYHAEFYPSGLWPIAESGGGDKILIGVAGAYVGQIFYFFHDRESPRPIPEAEDVEFLAQNFERFENAVTP